MILQNHCHHGSLRMIFRCIQTYMMNMLFCSLCKSHTFAAKGKSWFSLFFYFIINHHKLSDTQVWSLFWTFNLLVSLEIDPLQWTHYSISFPCDHGYQGLFSEISRSGVLCQQWNAKVYCAQSRDHFFLEGILLS